MTLSHRLRTAIEAITPRIPEHDRRELMEIAAEWEEHKIRFEKYRTSFLETTFFTVLGMTFPATELLGDGIRVTKDGQVWRLSQSVTSPDSEEDGA